VAAAAKLTFARWLVILSWGVFWVRWVTMQYPFTHLDAQDWARLVVPLIGLAAVVLAVLRKPRWTSAAVVAALVFIASFLFFLGEEVARTVRSYSLAHSLWEPFYGRWYAIDHCLSKVDFCFATILFDEVLMPLSQAIVLACVIRRPSNSLMQPTGQEAAGG
jgi:hypothetical protein